MQNLSILTLLMLALSFAVNAESVKAHTNTNQSSIKLRLDYVGAEAIISALERDSLSDADVDNLLRVHGVRAMVDNVTHYFPQLGVKEFRDEVKTFAQTKKGGSHLEYFQLEFVWNTREHVRSVIKLIKENEKEIIRQTLKQLDRYSPKVGDLTINVYFTGGGVSDGFLFDNQKDQPAFYVNLSTTDGSRVDYNGIIANMAHEAYHVVQKAAQRRAGLAAVADSTDKLPPTERLLAVLLFEGTANYVVDPTRSNAAGTDMEKSRQQYRRNADPARIKENFALFDTVLSGIRDGSLPWNKAYARGFSGNNDARFYFVGYEMAKAIEKYRGRKQIAQLFEKPPVEFIRQYIALYKKHPEISARFSKETEEFITSIR
jgi:hypothetical protein